MAVIISPGSSSSSSSSYSSNQSYQPDPPSREERRRDRRHRKVIALMNKGHKRGPRTKLRCAGKIINSKLIEEGRGVAHDLVTYAILDKPNEKIFRKALDQKAALAVREANCIDRGEEEGEPEYRDGLRREAKLLREAMSPAADHEEIADELIEIGHGNYACAMACYYMAARRHDRADLLDKAVALIDDHGFVPEGMEEEIVAPYKDLAAKIRAKQAAEAARLEAIEAKAKSKAAKEKAKAAEKQSRADAKARKAEERAKEKAKQDAKKAEKTKKNDEPTTVTKQKPKAERSPEPKPSPTPAVQPATDSRIIPPPEPDPKHPRPPPLRRLAMALLVLAVLAGTAWWYQSTEKSRRAQALFAEGARQFAAEQLQLAANSYLLATQLDGEFLEAHIALGNALFALGRPAAARESYDKALAVDPTASFALFSRGKLSWLQGDLSGATADLKRAASLRPGDRFFHDALARVLIEDGRNAAAEAAYRVASERNPDQDWPLWGWLGMIAADPARDDILMGLMRRLGAQRPNSAALAYYTGQVHYRRKAWRKAIAKFQAAIGFSPDEVPLEAYQFIAGAYLELGRPADCLKYAKEYVARIGFPLGDGACKKP